MAELGVALAAFDCEKTGIEDVRVGLEAETAEEGVPQGEVVEPDIVAEDCDVGDEVAGVCDCAADVDARVDEAEGLGECDFAEDVECEEAEPVLELDGGVGVAELVEAGGEKFQHRVDVGLCLCDVG